MASLGDGGRQAPRGRRTAMHTHHDLVRPDGQRSERSAVQHEVRRQAEEHVVLLAHRLALATVDQHDGASASGRNLVSHGSQLAGQRERGAAPPAQTRASDEVDQGAAGRRGRRHPVPRGVFDQVGRAAGGVKAGQQPVVPDRRDHGS